MPDPDADYEYALAAIPGEVIRELYLRYGPRLLEANVRTFLGIKSVGHVHGRSLDRNQTGDVIEKALLRCRQIKFAGVAGRELDGKLWKLVSQHLMCLAFHHLIVLTFVR